MEFTAPISRFMSRKMITVAPGDRMTLVKEIFEKNRIHHIPVVRHNSLVGIISKQDYMHFLRGDNQSPYDELVEQSRLHSYRVEDVMTTGIATLESSERVNVALEVLAENLFHAIPIVDNGELVGMFSTLDIIKTLQEEDLARIKAN